MLTETQQTYHFPSHLESAVYQPKSDDASRMIQKRVPMPPAMANLYAHLSGFQKYQ
jgi:hypothetical protein